jgi:hypothetical protein
MNSMNANEVLIDLLDDNQRRLKRVYGTLSDEGISWKPEAGANNILETVWHMGRILDVFLTQQAMGQAAQEECWFRLGWDERTGYDPRGIGQNGWGMLTGYTQEEVSTLPQLNRELVLGYLDEVYAAVRVYLENIPPEKLLTPGTSFEGRYSQYQCIQMALMDNIRHLGEIYAIKASYDRRRGLT